MQKDASAGLRAASRQSATSASLTRPRVTIAFITSRRRSGERNGDDPALDGGGASLRNATMSGAGAGLLGGSQRRFAAGRDSVGGQHNHPMPIAGGAAAKYGDRYEGRWTVRCLIEILSGDAANLTWNRRASLGEGAESRPSTPAETRAFTKLRGNSAVSMSVAPRP